ncbi:nuclear transport factor 2 family protein [Adhaeribacter aquaticus]|uniref:nuclear transport factor 2 family protein n=1 Tax=Adhaeribacter aquaticus TaxID=299567 RepID=UPI00047AF25B|nr:nuclear transport factor 2 family protein [Adhaeribacter aquaticus]
MTQEEQIIACENRLLDAIKNSDTHTLDELLHDSLIFNIPTGQTITKEMDIENYRSGIMTVNDISATDQMIKTIENISTVVVTIHLKAKYADQIIDGKFRYLRVWQLFNNSWQIIAGSGFQIQ